MIWNHSRLMVKEKNQLYKDTSTLTADNRYLNSSMAYFNLFDQINLIHFYINCVRHIFGFSMHNLQKKTKNCFYHFLQIELPGV